LPVKEQSIDRPPIALQARTEEPDMLTGIRIGFTKAIDLPWR
jgi:DNA-3-methyladenine glycosylase